MNTTNGSNASVDLNIGTLSGHFWEAPNILRGPVDAADFNLNIPRYTEPVTEEESMTIDQAIANLKESLQAAYTAEGRLKELLRREGLLP